MRTIQLSIIAFLICFHSVDSYAGPIPPAPTAPSTTYGTYTVSYTATGFEQVAGLQESLDNGVSWSLISSSRTGGGSVTVTRSAGIYLYRLMEWQWQWNSNYGERELEIVHSATTSVTVLAGTPPVVDEIEAQMAYEYVARTGDINSDGILDVFIQRTTGDLDNGVVAVAMLLRQADGMYARTVPSQAQLDAAELWPTIAIEYEIGDFNFDEVGDLVVGGLPDNAYMQILISSGVDYGRNAAAVIGVNEERLKYFRDLTLWHMDKTYFDDASAPDEPGYNIKIIYKVTTCTFFYWFPICYSYDFTLIDIDVKLSDLGLDGYLSAQGKPSNAEATSPSGVTTEAVASYISPEVYNAAAPQLAQYGIGDLNGTSAEKAIALDDMSEQVQSLPPDVLVCVWFCGYSVLDLGYFLQIVSWVDIWTPITIAGDFDEAMYSRAAFDISVILDDTATVESEVSDQDWQDIAAIASGALSVPIDVPFPVIGQIIKLSPFGRFLLGLWAITEVGTELDWILDGRRWGYHYTGITGLTGIPLNGYMVTSFTERVYLTPLWYWSAQQAEQLLALCGEPVIAVFQVKIPPGVPAIILPVKPKVCGPETLMAGTFRLGTGPEQWVPSPAQAISGGFPIGP